MSCRWHPSKRSPSTNTDLLPSVLVVDLFAGVCGADYAAGRAWYQRLFGSEPSFIAHETECVWELDEHRLLYIEEDPERAGYAVVTIFVDDFDALVKEIGLRGIEPAKRDTYSNGVRKATYRDPEGNEIGYGGAPAPNPAE